MPPIKIPFKRPSGLKNPTLVIIATEGQKTEKKYFEDLKQINKNTKIHIEVLKRTDPSKSAPKYVLNQLIDFKAKYKLQKHDSLWMVIDFDRWRISIPEVAKECARRKFKLAVSNPAFEIWLLLHYKSMDQYTQEEINNFNGNNLKLLLRQILGSYNPSKLNSSDFIPYTKTAITRAKNLDIDLSHRWPHTVGSRVYQLVEILIT